MNMHEIRDFKIRDSKTVSCFKDIFRGQIHDDHRPVAVHSGGSMTFWSKSDHFRLHLKLFNVIDLRLLVIFLFR